MTNEMTWAKSTPTFKFVEANRVGLPFSSGVHNERTIMHPFDSSLDTSFHKHSNQRDHRRKQTRRSSLDNGCFYDKNELIYMASASLDSSSHGSRTALPRRRSLNTEMVIPTTFLASAIIPNVNKITSDLDLDCHSWVKHENPQSKDYHSSHHTKPVEVTDDEHDSYRRLNESRDSTDFDDNEDSFCEASYAEPANKAYMMQGMGASCMIDDDMLHDIENDTDVDLAAFEALENDEHEATERGGEGHEGDFTASEECASFCDANDKEQANHEYLVRDLGASCFWANDDFGAEADEDVAMVFDAIAE